MYRVNFRRAASIAMVAGGSYFTLSADAAPPVSVIREHRTGLSFPLTRSTDATRMSSLLGANTRCMLGWCRLSIARAYAFGLFADEIALAAATRVPAGESRLAALLDSAESKTGTISLVLVIARSIEGDHLAHGFQNSVLNRYKKLLASGKRGGTGTSLIDLQQGPSRAEALSSGKAAAGLGPAIITTSITTAAPTISSGPLAELSNLCHGFSGHFFEVGDEAVLEWSNGVVSLSVNGKRIPGAELKDVLLARALFDVYAGDLPVSARAKSTFESNLNELALTGAGGGGKLTRVLPEITVKEHNTRTK
jgi:hypothetical protein